MAGASRIRVVLHLGRYMFSPQATSRQRLLTKKESSHERLRSRLERITMTVATRGRRNTKMIVRSAQNVMWQLTQQVSNLETRRHQDASCRPHMTGPRIAFLSLSSLPGCSSGRVVLVKEGEVNPFISIGSLLRRTAPIHPCPSLTVVLDQVHMAQSPSSV